MPLLRKDQLAATISNDESLATTLLVACLDEFGTDFFDWEPVTFDLEAKAAFGTEMPQSNRDKLWALVTALTTDSFYVSLESFLPICNSLNGAEANFKYYDPVTSEEAAWAITEVMLNDPPKQDMDPSMRFSDEIKRYVGLTLRAEGITEPPPVLAPYAIIEEGLEDRAGAIIGPDESMLKMHSDRQQREKKEIEQYVNERLDQLGAQLQALPLRRGNTSGLLNYLQQARTAATEIAQAGESALPQAMPVL
jgi:hypothetical protein